MQDLCDIGIYMVLSRRELTSRREVHVSKGEASHKPRLQAALFLRLPCLIHDLLHNLPLLISQLHAHGKESSIAIADGGFAWEAISVAFLVTRSSKKARGQVEVCVQRTSNRVPEFLCPATGMLDYFTLATCRQP